MAETLSLDRIGPLASRLSAAVTPLGPRTRYSFRGDVSACRALGAAFGVKPGEAACRARHAGERAALWLGPDEWLLIGPAGRDGAGEDALRRALATAAHSLVDVSHRNAGFLVEGPGAATLLAEGCPLDLSLTACPVDLSTRTVLGKCEIVLWRCGPDAFHIECWRSFATYLSAFLAQAARNL